MTPRVDVWLEDVEAFRRWSERASEALVLYEPGTRRLLAANATALGVTGWEHEALRGRTLDDLLSFGGGEATKSDAWGRLSAVGREGGVWQVEGDVFARRPGGELLRVGLSASRARAGDAPLGLLAASAGGLEPDGRAEAFARFARLSSELCCTVGLDGCFLMVNPVWESVLGHPPEELLGRPLDRWVGSADLNRARRAFGRLGRGKLARFDAAFTHRDGSPRRLVWRFTFAGGLGHGIARPANPESSLPAVCRGCPVLEGIDDDDNNASKHARRAREGILAHISHEIRTPMTAILGYTELAIERCGTGDAAAASEGLGYLEIVRQSGERLLDRLSDVLEHSRIEADAADARIVLKPCRIAAVVAEAAVRARARGKEKGLDFTVELAPATPPIVRTDVSRLRRILHQLLGNALKFTDRGGVRLELRPGNLPGWLEFVVSDTGVGIGPEEMANLFPPFDRSDPPERGTPGSAGLGLAVSQRLTRQIGGTISARSVPGAGSVFTLAIPVGDPSAGAAPQRLAPAPAPEPARGRVASTPPPTTRIDARVLLAEDNRENQRVIALRLTAAGARVTVAPNGRAAVELAVAARDAGRPFDLVLMDMQMPVLDGYEATRILRAERFTTPIVALTAYAMPEDRQECLRFGCDAHVSKPIDWQALFALTTALLATERRERPSARLGD